MRLLSIAALSALLVACGDETKEPTTTDTIDYSKLEASTPSDSPLTLATDSKLNQHIKNGLRLQLKNGPTYYYRDDIAFDGGELSAPTNSGADAGGAPPTENQKSSNDGFSDTNVHVQGVDEADYAKYDGQHWFVATSPHRQNYLIDNQKPGFQIVATDPSTPNAEVISRVQLDQDDESWGNVSEMYLVQNNDSTTHIATIRNQWGNIGPYLPGMRITTGLAIDIAASVDMAKPAVNTALRVAAPVDLLYPNPQNSRVRIQLTDVENPALPTQDWEMLLDGSLIDSRKVGNMLYLLTRFDPWVGGLYYDSDDADVRSKNEEALSAVGTDQLLPYYEVAGVKKPLSNSCYLQNDTTEYRGYTSLVNITAIDLSNQKLVSSQCINDGLEAMSMSADSLYLTGTVYEPNDNTRKTVVHKFTLNEQGPQYAATGSVNGSLGWNSDINFRMHEHEDTFRIVTSNRSNEGPEHMLTILEQQGATLNTLSTLPNNAYPDPIGKPLEEIYSVRFEKDRAYIVTFRRTDPLYAIDLSDPENPFIAGELEIPGFATYMHPVGEGYLFTLGRDADENGRAQGMKAELIDVSGDTPQVLTTLLFEGRSTNSEALQDLKALSFKQDDSRLRITMPITKYSENNTWEYTGLQLMEITGTSARSDALIAAPQQASLVNVGTIIGESANNIKGYYPSYGINRSVIHDNAVFFAHNNSFWAANWSEPKDAVGPITEEPTICTAQVVPALDVTLQLEGEEKADPCSATVTAYNQYTGKEITLEASSENATSNACHYIGYGSVGEYNITAVLDGYRYQKAWAVVYRDPCHVITENVGITLAPEEPIVCTTEARSSLEVFVDIEESEGAYACDASVIAIQDGVQYQLEGRPHYEYGADGDTASGEGESSKTMLVADPLPPEEILNTRCVFSGPYEVAGAMHVEVQLDGYSSETIEEIYVDRDECHVITHQSKVWLGLQPE